MRYFEIDGEAEKNWFAWLHQAGLDGNFSIANNKRPQKHCFIGDRDSIICGNSIGDCQGQPGHSRKGSRDVETKICEAAGRYIFFIKPRIKIGRLHDHQIDITISSNRQNPELFNGIIWTIPVENNKCGIGKVSFSRDATNCFIGINIIRNRTPIFRRELRMGWLGVNPLPNTCDSGSLVGATEIRQEYATHLPFCFMGEVFRFRTQPTHMPKDTDNEALFLFTFPESEFMYIIPSVSFTEEEILSLPLNTEYGIHLNFHSEDHHTRGKRFNLIAHAWDDLELK